MICGPTASGKTAAAIELAQEIGAEIISVDSGQVYRGMDIGTAKPTLEERRKARFHLIDLINPDQQFSAADFRKRAEEAIADIQSRGRRVILCGGTGLYLKALEGGLFEGPAKDPELRRGLEERIVREGVESLHRELQKIDPEAAKAIPSKNRQRIIRALEVWKITGRPISEFWKGHDFKGKRYSFEKIGLMPPTRGDLHRRIEERVDRMIGAELVDEVRGLLKKWGKEAPGLKIIGYKEIVAYLEGGLSLQEAVSLIKQNTRRYAKRQVTWFKRDSEIRWEREWIQAGTASMCPEVPGF